MEKKVVGVTGHRPKYYTTSQHRNWIYEELRKAIGRAQANGFSYLISGGAIGVDSWAIDICFALNFPYIVARPFPSQSRLWSQADQDRALVHDRYALHVEIVNDGEYEAWKMFKCNEWIVDNSTVMIAGLNGNKTNGGTFGCVKYAKHNNRKIFLCDAHNSRAYWG